MSSPLKPWEKSTLGPCDIPSSARTVEDTAMNSNPLYSGIGLHSHAPMPSVPTATSNTQQQLRRAAPPPPPAVLGRMNQGYALNYGGTAGGYGGNMYGMGMGGYGANSYGGFGTTGGFGGIGTSGYGVGSYGAGGYGAGGYGNTYGRYGGYGMNRFNQNPMNNLENRFIQMAEESSRPAFESIESIVQTFGSVSFMMESTFGALYSSFRAVLGVAENFGRLRTLFGQVFSTFAVLQFFQWAYRKLLYLLGLRADDPRREAIWQQVSGGSADPASGGPHRSMWPVTLFIGIVCSGPYLVWKLLSSLKVPPPTTPIDDQRVYMSWVASRKPLYKGVAKYNFQARTDVELSVNANQKLVVAPADFQTGGRDWVLVYDSQKSGYIPTSYLGFGGPLRAVTRHGEVSNPTTNESEIGTPLVEEPVAIPQLSETQADDLQDNSFPQLEQFTNEPSTSSFHPGDFEPKIGSTDGEVEGDKQK